MGKYKKLWTHPLHCAIHIMHERDLKASAYFRSRKVSAG
jgi:hypothetical protein